MAVLIAEDVKQGLSTNERAQLELFEANPGRGGERGYSWARMRRDVARAARDATIGRSFDTLPWC